MAEGITPALKAMGSMSFAHAPAFSAGVLFHLSLDGVI
jgi:hypothetical protein